MLYIIGIGLNVNNITLEALEKIRNCKKVFFESYTSIYGNSIEQLQKVIGVEEITVLERKDLENESRKIISLAKEENICVLIIGNPFFATTHSMLVEEAISQNVKFEVVVGISIYDYLLKSGLSCYKISPPITIVEWLENYSPESFYDKIKENFFSGKHSFCLLDIKYAKEMGKAVQMPLEKAVEQLKKIAEKRNEDWIFKSKILLCLDLGTERESFYLYDFFELSTENAIKKLPKYKVACFFVINKLEEYEKTILKKMIKNENK